MPTRQTILVVNYSQSGQLDEILDALLKPFSEYLVERISLYPKDEMLLPWEMEVFFEKMPETVLEIPISLKPYQFKLNKYDLIIIGYQPWFLSPSQPITALFNDELFKQKLKDTPVITVIGARNMWLASQRRIISWINDAGGNLVANIPFIDKTQNHLSIITILHWMLTGNKTRKWGVLPLPGVSLEDISNAVVYSKPIILALSTNNFIDLQKNILALGGKHIATTSLLIEDRAKKIFTIWANLIVKKTPHKKKRRFMEKCFKFYLIIALFVIYPITYPLLIIFNSCILSKKKHKALYLGIEK